MKQTRQGLTKFGCIKKYTVARFFIKGIGEGIAKNIVEQIVKHSNLYSLNKRDKTGLTIYKKAFNQLINYIAVVRAIRKEPICRFTFPALKSNLTYNPAI